jgi:hypothetical protein
LAVPASGRPARFYEAVGRTATVRRRAAQPRQVGDLALLTHETSK